MKNVTITAQKQENNNMLLRQLMPTELLNLFTKPKKYMSLTNTNNSSIGTTENRVKILFSVPLHQYSSTSVKVLKYSFESTRVLLKKY